MVINIIRDVVLFIDLMLSFLFYWIARLVVQTFFELSKITSGIVVFNEPFVSIIQRIMVLVGVFALFKLSITFINYAINPDKTENGSENGIKIVQNIFVSIVLLSISSTAFTYLGKISDAIFTGNGNGVSVINRVVFGDKPSVRIISENQAMNANSVEAMSVVQHVRGLFINDNGACDNDQSKKCTYYREMLNGIIKPNAISDLDLAKDKKFTYIPVLSWMAAIFVTIVFGIYTIDLAKRLLKLIVLQIISPIPIIMYIDPKQQNRLTLFVQTYFSIWLQVFFRILTVYLAYVIMDLTATGQLIEGVSDEIKWIIKFVIYLGVLLGASEIPRLIDDIIGTKLAGDSKGMNFGAILGGIVGGTIGAFGGAVAGGFTGAAAGGGFKNMASGILAGGAKGLSAGMQARKSGNIFAGIGAVGKSWSAGAKTAGNVIGAGGIFAYGRGAVENAFGGKGRDAARIKAFDEEIKTAEENKAKVLKADEERINCIHNKTASSNNQIAELNSKMSLRNQASQLRSNLETVMNSEFESKYGNFDTYFGYAGLNDKDYYDYKNLESYVNENSKVAGYNQEDLSYEKSLLSDKKAALEARYQSAKESYFDSQIAQASPNFAGSKTGDYSEKIASAAHNYNDFVNAHDMSDQAVTSYSGESTGMKHASDLNESDIKSIQEQMNSERETINNYNKEIERIREEKVAHEKEEEAKIEAIKKDKGNFEESPGRVRRGNRTTGNDGGIHKPTKWNGR